MKIPVHLLENVLKTDIPTTPNRRPEIASVLARRVMNPESCGDVHRIEHDGVERWLIAPFDPDAPRPGQPRDVARIATVLYDKTVEKPGQTVPTPPNGTVWGWRIDAFGLNARLYVLASLIPMSAA